MVAERPEPLRKGAASKPFDAAASAAPEAEHRLGGRAAARKVALLQRLSRELSAFASKLPASVITMPDTDAILTWLWLPSLFTAAWLAAGADLMTGAR